MDNIKIAFSDNDKISEIAKRNADEIKEETLGVEISYNVNLKFAKEWNINGEKVVISVEKN